MRVTAARPPGPPCARLWVATTVTTVASMTMLELRGWVTQLLQRGPAEGADRDHDHDGDQGGHRDPRRPSRRGPGSGTAGTRRRRRSTARPRPPDFTLMTDWPIMAQPAMPPKKPVTMLAMPWPDALAVLVARGCRSCRRRSWPSSAIPAGPTTAMAAEYGQDDQQRVEVERHVGQQEDRERRRQLAHVADRPHGRARSRSRSRSARRCRPAATARPWSAAGSR